MANPFGEVVDNEKLNENLRYLDQPKSQKDRAREAVNLKNDKGKNNKAANYVQTIKDFYGSAASTLCLLYNATGDTLYYVTDHDWLGFVSRTPYPTEIGNGQWAAFLHVHPTGKISGSEAAVVYRGKNKDGQDKDYLVAWCNPFPIWYNNKSYSDVGPVGSFGELISWGDVKGKLENADYTHETNKDGSKIEVDIAAGSSPMFHATFSMPDNP